MRTRAANAVYAGQPSATTTNPAIPWSGRLLPTRTIALTITESTTIAASAGGLAGPSMASPARRANADALVVLLTGTR